MTDNVHPIMTDDELDDALARLHADRPGAPRLDTARQALATALGAPPPAPERPRRHWRRWASAAAVVTALVAGGLVAENVVGGDQATASAAALTLRQAATAAIHEHDPVLRPGQYLYIRVDSVDETLIADGRTTLDYLKSEVTETWVPADRKADWRLRTSEGGPLRWIIGSAAQAKADGVDVRPAAPTDITAPCGAFYSNGDAAPACVDSGPGNWQEPTPAWLAGLPTEPARMLAMLRADIPKNLGDSEVLTYVADALRAGQVPANVRAVMYQALALLPDLTVTQQVVTLDGGKGVAMGVVDPASPVRQEIVVDPRTGQFIGERSVTQRKYEGLPAGAVAASSSVTTTVVDGIGRR